MRDCDACGRTAQGYNRRESRNGRVEWLCDDCAALEEERDTAEREQYDADHAGERCSAACGWCGRCT